MGEPAGPGANQATGPPGFNGHRRKGPGGAAPLYRGPRWRDEARRGRAVSAGASFGSSAASPYTLASEQPTRDRGATRCVRPLTRAAILTDEAEVRTALRPESEQQSAGPRQPDKRSRGCQATSLPTPHTSPLQDGETTIGDYAEWRDALLLTEKSPGRRVELWPQFPCRAW